MSDPNPPESLTTLSFYAHVAYEDDYVQPLIINAFETVLKPGSYLLVDKPPAERYISPVTKYLQIMQYESLPHQLLLSNPITQFGNSYTIRKALIRKNYLAQTVASWVAKNPTSPLKDHVPITSCIEFDYADNLDESLWDAWEARKSLKANESKKPADREWWILKPAMSDKGHGIRLFSTEAEIETIFRQWEEADLSDTDNEEEDAEEEVEVEAG